MHPNHIYDWSLINLNTKITKHTHLNQGTIAIKCSTTIICNRIQNQESSWFNNYTINRYNQFVYNFLPKLQILLSPTNFRSEPITQWHKSTSRIAKHISTDSYKIKHVVKGKHNDPYNGISIHNLESDSNILSIP